MTLFSGQQPGESPAALFVFKGTAGGPREAMQNSVNNKMASPRTKKVHEYVPGSLVAGDIFTSPFGRSMTQSLRCYVRGYYVVGRERGGSATRGSKRSSSVTAEDASKASQTRAGRKLRLPRPQLGFHRKAVGQSGRAVVGMVSMGSRD